MARPTPEQWADARRRWEAGKASFGELARDLNVHKSTVHRHSQREAWKGDVASKERAEQTVAATEARRRSFADRREDEAVHAANMAALTRGTVTRLIRLATDDRVPAKDRIPLEARQIRELAVAYGIFIDKAQLLAGEATARFEGIGTVGPDERRHAVLGLLDELQQRRELKAVGE